MVLFGNCLANSSVLAAERNKKNKSKEHEDQLTEEAAKGNSICVHYPVRVLSKSSKFRTRSINKNHPLKISIKVGKDH